jgi:hypothetical protein
MAIWSRGDRMDGNLVHHSDYAEVGVKPENLLDVLLKPCLLADSPA